jgi:hypothetical protein
LLALMLLLESLRASRITQDGNPERGFLDGSAGRSAAPEPDIRRRGSIVAHEPYGVRRRSDGEAGAPTGGQGVGGAGAW